MKNKELFLKALEGLVSYPGGDLPPENYWSLMDFVDFYEAETGHKLNLPVYNESGEWAEAVIEAIRNDGNEDTLENENPNDMGPDDQGLIEEIKRIKKLL